MSGSAWARLRSRLASGLRPGRRWIAAVIALGLLAAFVVLLLGVTQRRMRSEGASCTARCHTRMNEMPSHGRHTGVACQQCHEVTQAAAASLALRALVAPRSHPAPHGAAGETQCARCHEREDERRFAMAASTAGHRAHASGPGRTGCLSCHTEHGDATYGRTACVRCHGDASVHKSAIQGAADIDRCTTCHAFTREAGKGGTAATIVDACARCHGDSAAPAKSDSGTTVPASAVVSKEVLHGEVDCTLCHNPTGGPHAGDRAGECGRCHAIASPMSAGEPAGHQLCAGCHAPHAPQRDAVTSCNACHRQQATARASTERTTALQHDSCHSCHQPHTWVAERAGCVKCHDAQSKMLLASAPKQHARCQDCHAPHEPPPTAATCLGCHKPLARAAAVAPEKHAICTSCHTPHGAAKDASGACARCHTGERAQLFADKPAAHKTGGCLSCHTQHGDPKAGAASCRTCHRPEADHAKTAGPEPHQRCESCHQPHAFAIASTTAACTRCHTTAAVAGGSHRGSCESCHTPHGPPRVQQAACLDCHRNIDHKNIASRSSGPKRESAWAAGPIAGKHPDGCAGCHAPHMPAAAATARCRDCHTAIASVAARWPQSPHRSDCTSCHSSHDTRKASRCDGCHTTEARAFAGDSKHSCTGCHKPHLAPPANAPDRWWSRCDGCHQAEAEGARPRGATHGACSSCHASHGAAVRSTIKGCKSCHLTIETQAMHMTPKHHEDCNACHSPHKAVAIDRATCLSCHRDKVAHKPDSPRCQACHLFQ